MEACIIKAVATAAMDSVLSKKKFERTFMAAEPEWRYQDLVTFGINAKAQLCSIPQVICERCLKEHVLLYITDATKACLCIRCVEIVVAKINGVEVTPLSKTWKLHADGIESIKTWPIMAPTGTPPFPQKINTTGVLGALETN
jgi:hypothetical protein